MGAVDNAFFDTLRAMQKLSRETLLTDTFPPTATHNIGARILRHGLSVSAFAVLERYVEAKFTELMLEIGSSAIAYASLPDALKKYLTVDAVAGLSNRTFFLDDVDALPFAELNIERIASFNQNVRTYTAFGFSPRGSNVSDKDIREAFAACGVGGAWALLSIITQEIGGARVSLSVDYRNLAKNRHRSAHNPDGNVPTSDLQTHIETATLVGIAVGILARGIATAYTAVSNTAALQSALGAMARTYRFVDEEAAGTWVERVATSGTIVKRYPDEAAAVAGATARMGSRIVVVRDLRRVPVALA